MRRTALTALTLALLLGTAGCSAVATNGGSAPTTDHQAAPADGPTRTIQVSASGSAETAPDQAVIRLSVVATGDDPGDVRTRLARNVSAVRSALEDLDLGVEQVRTVEYDIGRGERELPEGAERERPAYRGEHGLAVTVDNVSRVGDVIEATVDAGDGDVRIQGVRFTLSEETRRGLRQQALADAMDSARAQATTLAREAKLDVAGVLSVSTTERDFQPRTVERTAAAGDAPTMVESGPVSVSVTVQVTYNATSA